VIILGLSTAAMFEPGMLRKAFPIHPKRQQSPSLPSYAVNAGDGPKENEKDKEKEVIINEC